MNLSALKISDENIRGYVYTLRVITFEEVRTLRSQMNHAVATWESSSVLGHFGQPTESRAYLREVVRDRVDEFINAYLATNPR